VLRYRSGHAQGFWREVAALRAEWCIPAVMDRWRRCRSRRPGGRAGGRHAGVTALAVLAVTAALAVLRRRPGTGTV